MAFFAGKIDWAYFLRYVWIFDKLDNSLKKGNLVMKKFFAEVIGTFMLVFIGTGAVVFGNGTEGLGHLGIALAFGLSIVAAAYSIGTVSGAHLNPAVSIAMFVNKRLSSKDLINYIAAQVVGAVLASFIFILVIMTVTSATKGNGKIAGLVIGLSLTLIILIGLNITGLSVNPARSLAPALFVGGAALQQIWIFILAPIVGGVLAAIVAKNLLDTEE